MAVRPDMYAAESDDTNWVEIVAAPPAGTRRVIKTVIVYNGDSATKDYQFALYDGTTYWVQGGASNVATLTPADMAIWENFVVKPTWSGHARITTAETTAKSQFSVHWMDHIQEGERAD